MILPMFFALSGFLVAGSLTRSKTIVSFLYLRVIRIFPALVVEVTLSAIVLGSLFTTHTFADYVRDGEFRRYFLNIFGDIHYTLPGVFSGNPLPSQVNAQLWTIPYELKCYIVAALVGLVGIRRRRGLFLFSVLALQLVIAQRMLVYGILKTAVPGNVLVLCFLFGVTIYLYRDKVYYSGKIALFAGALCLGLLYSSYGGYFVALPVAYITVYLGLQNPKNFGLPRGGDYSYGIYLYGFPIQQAVAALGEWTHSAAVNLILSLPVIAMVASLSWHLVERPALSARTLQPAIDKLALRLWRSLSHRAPFAKVIAPGGAERES
jgi:peptidoglycan/LPS O-acetylase OafA/YrhL